MDVTKAAIVESFGRVARPIMRAAGMEPASCVGSARVTIETLRLFRIKAEAVPVCFLFHVPQRKYARTAGLPAAERRRLKAAATNWREDVPASGLGWNGHLIVLAENRWFLDPSIDQANNDEFGVPVESRVLVVDTSEVKANPRKAFEMRLVFTLTSGDFATLLYRRTGDRSYLTSGAWNDEGIPLLAALIVRGMLRDLGEG